MALFQQMRLSSSRNQRSKVGLRLKHFLQICLLLAICTWLLYQIMLSYSKKIAFEERITNKLAEQQPELFPFGRKGLPVVKENDSGTGSKDEDIEEGQEEEGEQEHGMRRGEAEDDEEGKYVDDLIDGLDGGEENEQAEESTSEKEKDGHVEEEEGLFGEQEHDESVQEAREENYKRDDVSSAVPYVSEADGKEVELSKPENGSVSTSLSTKGSNQKELQPNRKTETLPENNIEVAANMSYSQMRIQKNPSLVYSLSTRENPQHLRSAKTDTKQRT